MGWAEDDIPVKQDVKLRIWSCHVETAFDASRDAPGIEELLSQPGRPWRGRVVSRFHFDRAGAEQRQGPRFHVQVGGVPEEYELCWHPKSINVPRLEYPPVELFLTCQMVAANFFWDEYVEIRETSEWRQELLMYQKGILLEHYRECVKTIESNLPLLDALWVR